MRLPVCNVSVLSRIAWDVVFDCPDKFSPVRSPYGINNAEKALGSLLKAGILQWVLTTVSVSLSQHSALQMAAFPKERSPVPRNRHVIRASFLPSSFLILF